MTRRTLDEHVANLFDHGTGLLGWPPDIVLEANMTHIERAIITKNKIVAEQLKSIGRFLGVKFTEPPPEPKMQGGADAAKVKRVMASFMSRTAPGETM